MAESITNKTMVEVVNKRNRTYTVSLPNGEYYEWLAADNGMEDSHEMLFKDVQYLHTRSSTFKKGHLYLNHEEARKRLGLEKESVKALTMSRDEIEKLLKGNLNQLKKLDQFKNERGLVQEILDVAKAIPVTNISKLNYLAELSGLPVDLIAPKDADEE